MIRIDRCICFERTFSELKQAAEDARIVSIPELQEHVAFGSNCGLCLPYVERMLLTGATTFNEVIDGPGISNRQSATQQAASGNTASSNTASSKRQHSKQ